MIDELMTEDEAAELLAPHRAALASFLLTGWADWIKLVEQNPILATVRNTTRANIVYDRVTELAEAYFDGEGITTTRSKQFLAVTLADGRLILRFKKFTGRSMRTSGIPTAQRLEIEAQQVELDGMAVTHLTVGYLPDDLGVELDLTAVVCSFNGRPLWSIDLDAAETGSVVPVKSRKPVGPTVRSTRPAAREDEAEGQ
ncbi:hypothetical protein [Rathayibacter sp. VKM Ac-2801]|uniref:hypothetical protein n=1 Tax=Rathayibacter sp. VKM Ac-2801 TaxID=2609255 RepID=UPI00131FFB43|nr:hypothetical protein [Rathayibacter sp. VKM Ac-2801]QHC70784.1 hypothetical protein GSU45_10680 [Rathayibacter sp. VKM Ac-2801]